MKKKEERLKDMQQEMDKLNRVVEYLFYYGDRVDQFQIDKILQLAAEVETRRARQKPAEVQGQEDDEEEEEEDEDDDEDAGYS